MTKKTKQNCWEFMKCGRGGGGKRVGQLGVCPAFPDNGQNCANVAGTFCDLVQGVYAAKYTSCDACNFYNSEHYDKSKKKIVF